MVQAELHQEPKKSRTPLQPVQRTIKHCKNILAAQPTENREHQLLVEQLEVPEDNQAANRNIKKVMNYTEIIFKAKRIAARLNLSVDQ